MNNGNYRTICTLCHSGCGIVVTVKENKIVSIVPDKQHPSNRNYLCPKVFSLEEISKSKDRITQPLKKVEDGFQQISWDEAYSIVAENLQNAIEKHGPNGVIRCSGAPVDYSARDGFNHLMQAMNSTNATGSSAYCMVPRVTAFINSIGGKPEPDFDNSDFIILWGSNPKATNRMGGYCSFNGIQDVLNRARKRGSKIVFIDPIKNESITNQDFWIRINPGTDTYLGLGMINQIIIDKLYDKEFVENYTKGFEELSEYVKDFTPQVVEKETGIPASIVVALAKDFARAKTATICEGNGLDMYCNTVYAVQTIAILCGITGRIDKKGGLVFLPFVKQTPVNKLKPSLSGLKPKFPLFRDVPFSCVKESLLNDDENRPHVMVVHHANPVLINANTQRTKSALEKLDFLVVCDIFMTATAQMADIILPEKTAFESFGYKAYTSFEKPFIAFQQPVIDAPGQTKSVFEIEYQIAKKMGLNNEYEFFDEKSWIDFELKPENITFEKLQTQQLIFLDKPIVYEKYKHNGFNTVSKKMEFYSSKMEEYGYSPLPLPLVGNPDIGMIDEEYPLLAINYRPSSFVHTKLHNIERITTMHSEPMIWLNSTNMGKYGLACGEKVSVETKNGCEIFTVELNDGLLDCQMLIEFGWGNPTDNKANINNLTSDKYWDSIAGGTPNRLFKARIKKLS